MARRRTVAAEVCEAQAECAGVVDPGCCGTSSLGPETQGPLVASRSHRICLRGAARALAQDDAATPSSAESRDLTKRGRGSWLRPLGSEREQAPIGTVAAPGCRIRACRSVPDATCRGRGHPLGADAADASSAALLRINQPAPAGWRAPLPSAAAGVADARSDRSARSGRWPRTVPAAAV